MNHMIKDVYLRFLVLKKKTITKQIKNSIKLSSFSTKKIKIKNPAITELFFMIQIFFVQ